MESSLSSFPLTIRVAQLEDLPELAQLFKQTVLAIAPQRYSHAQTQVWASFAQDPNHFRPWITTATTYVAQTVDTADILGFAGIAPDGHITATYVRHDRIRQGIGTALMHQLLDHAKTHQIPRLYTEASEFSWGLFQKFGFQQYDTEIVERQDVQFTRYLMAALSN